MFSIRVHLISMGRPSDLHQCFIDLKLDWGSLMWNESYISHTTFFFFLGLNSGGRGMGGWRDQVLCVVFKNDFAIQTFGARDILNNARLTVRPNWKRKREDGLSKSVIFWYFLSWQNQVSINMERLFSSRIFGYQSCIIPRFDNSMHLFLLVFPSRWVQPSMLHLPTRKDWFSQPSKPFLLVVPR